MCTAGVEQHRCGGESLNVQMPSEPPDCLGSSHQSQPASAHLGNVFFQKGVSRGRPPSQGVHSKVAWTGNSLRDKQAAT